MRRALPVLLVLAACSDRPTLSAPVVVERSLFFTQPEIVDAYEVTGLGTLLGRVASDGHGGEMLAAWLHRFATTAHSERAGPAQLADELVATLGPPATWDMTRLPFRTTGVHNRIDLAEAGHCGELRVSFASVHAQWQPLHLIFLFRQPADPDGGCATTARAWAELSALTGDAWTEAARARLLAGLTGARFLMAESVELTVSPWEWRQWVPVGDDTFDNPPLLQQPDPVGLNEPGPLRDDFLAWVDANRDGISARTAVVPERFRRPSVRVVQGVPRVPIDLGDRPLVVRQELELMGCAGCHTADAEFVQTRPDRTTSPFYTKELAARALYLEDLATGGAIAFRFGPLQADPVPP